MVVGLGVGTTTGLVEPARDWGPRLAYSIIPVPNCGSGDGTILGTNVSHLPAGSLRSCSSYG